MTKIADKTPSEIDAEIAEYGNRIASQQAGLAQAEAQMKRLNEGRRVYDSPETIERRIAKYNAEIAVLKAEAAPFTDAYRAAPWSRYFLATSSNGHIHSSTSCSTCNNGYGRTNFNWLTEFSGADADAMIEIFGEDMCSECFPSAPAIAKGFRKSEADREAKRQEREAKRAAKFTAIYPDGRSEVFKTRRAGENALASLVRDAIHDSLRNGNYADHAQAVAQAIAEAIAEKHGENAAEILAAANAKQVKKILSAKRKDVRDFKAGRWGLLGQPSVSDADRARYLAETEAEVERLTALAA